MNQRTIKSKISFSGIGLHSGKKSTLSLLPGDKDLGIRFKRVDLENQNEIPADVGYVVSTDRATTLSNGKVEIQTVEHLLSAIYGMGIDNVIIEVDGPEIPILDGNSSEFAECIKKVGIVEQEKQREEFSVAEIVQFCSSNGQSEYLLLPSEDTEVTVMQELEKYGIANQTASLEDFSDYAARISSCRTYVFIHELRDLFSRNLIKGGNLSNAIILTSPKHQQEISGLSEYLTSEEMKRLELHLDEKTSTACLNELAGHKLLDLLGDIALLGKFVRGRLIAKNPGHASNIEFTRHLKQLYTKQKKLKDKPLYDENQEPVHDVEGIQRLLPHRYPFLLVDKIIELNSTRVVGIKNISFNEYFFQGHFPGNPVFPGVLQMEALAQTGGILALSNVEKADEWDTYFIKMDNVRFKQKVMPGDTLILKMELLSPIRRGIVHMQGTAYVGNKIVSEGELTAQIVHARKPVNE